MPVQQNLNVSPYYDDFDPNKNYYRTLFKPGYALQSRELTGLQSSISDQIEQLASKFISPGDNVIPGEYTYANPVAYVKIRTASASASEYVGYKLTGEQSGVVASVLHAEEATESDSVTFFVSYDTSGNSNEYTTFQEGENLISNNENTSTAVVGVSGIDIPTNSPAMGSGCLFSVTNGSYFVNGFMVRTYEQTIVVSKYSLTPSYQIGFVVTESFVSSNEDSSLLDNSQGYSNFAAPGADRLKIVLNLEKLDIGATVPNFIRLATVTNGSLQGSPAETIKWDWLFDILAKRTYDESGDYIVRDFVIQPLEYVNTFELDGIYNPDEFGTYPAIPNSGSVDLLTYDEAEAKYVLNVSNGLAYVQGYEVGFDSSFYKFGDKARDTEFRNNASLNISDGPFFYLSKVYGAPDLQNITTDGSAVALSNITLYRNFTDGYTGTAFISGTSIPQNLGNSPQTTYHIVCNGPVGQTQYNEVYRGGNSVVISGTNDVKRGDTLGGALVLYVLKIPALPVGIVVPKFFQPSNIVASGGYYNYKSEYKLGISTVEYFTHISVDADPSGEWVSGEILTGESSQATAIVESGSVSDMNGYSVLVLSNVVGEFIPGEKISTSTKNGRIFENGEVASFVFNDVGVGSVYSLDSETGVEVSCLGATQTLTGGDIVASTTEIKLTSAGREKLKEFTRSITNGEFRRLSYNLKTIPGEVGGYAINPSIPIKNSPATTKSFYSALVGLDAEDTTGDFSGDISGENASHIESYVLVNNGAFSGFVGDNFVSCDNYSGDPSSEIRFGDIVAFIDDDGNSVTKEVLFATEPSGYGSLRTPAYIYFTTTLVVNVTGKTIERIRTKKFGNSSDNLIYQLPQKVIKTLESSPNSTDIRYRAFREFFVSYNSGADSVAITTSSPNEQFVSNDENTIITITRVSGGIAPELEGKFIVPNSITSSEQDNGKKLVIGITPIDFSVKLKIITTVYVTDAKAKKKSVVKYEDGAIDNRIVVASPNSKKNIISLGITDVFKLYSVKDKVGVNEIDVTDNYIFDDGQRDNIYDISRLILKSNRPPALGDLYITCDAFVHSTDGDFFSVDSYTHDEGLPYKKIPVYAPSISIADQQQTTPSNFVELRDCVDFRPTVNTRFVDPPDPSDPSTIPGISGDDSQSARNFKDASFYGNSDVPRFLVPGSVFQCDIEYYLPRIDSLFLDRSGELRLTQGVSDMNPKAPNDESAAIRLYDMILSPYTFSAEDIYIKKYNYRRYTMKDISELDNRLSKVEEYVSLSLLEQSAMNAQVRDSITGLDRFKNGFIVDPFQNHSNGNTLSAEYRCSIDPKSNHLRPPHFTDQVTLEEINQLDHQRQANFYAKTGPLLTLPYSSVEFIKNPFATRTVNLQPFSVFTYVGEIQLEPSVDTWQEIRRRDRLVIEDNTLYNSMLDMSGDSSSMNIGTVWGDWETTSSRLVPTETVTFAEAERRGLTIEDGGGSIPFTMRPVAIGNTSVLSQTRAEFSLVINPETSTSVETSQGDRVIDTQISRTMRTVSVTFEAYRLKPNTKYYAFFDGVDVNAWVSPDAPIFIEEDGTTRFVNVGNTNPKGFGEEIITDSAGVVTGIFLIPNGHSPIAGTTFNGDLDSVQYNTTSIPRNFDTGTRSFRLTTNRTNGLEVDAYGETGFTSSGVILDKQETIISTRVPSIERVATGITSDRQTTENRLRAETFIPPPPPQRRDPVAQTFLVDENNPDGVFVTDIDVYFSQKDEVESVMVYLVTTEGQVPTETIIPFSMTEKRPDSILRVTCELGLVNKETLTAGTVVVGQTSGARGVIKSNIDFDSLDINPTRNVTNTTYNLILSNYLNEFVAGELIVPEVSPKLNSKFTIVNDEISITRIDVRKLGSGYSTATVNFSAPDLPGGEVYEADAVISNGKIVKIVITKFGTGYTNIPTITLTGNGSGAEFKVRIRDNRKSVIMGVATSEDATASTKFRFQAPVYLLGNTNYAFVLKSENSIKYKAYISKLGENIIGTQTRVVSQPLLGSIFRSQNGGLWTEEQSEDIMFTLNRAEFVTNSTAIINLENQPLGMEVLDKDPIETNSISSTISEDMLFGSDAKIVRVYMKTHGNLPGDYVYIEGIQGVGSPERVNGIPVSEINGLHEVLSADFNTFTIKLTTSATSTGKAGGSSGKCSYNRPFEVFDIRSGSLLFKNTTYTTTVRAAGCAGLTGAGILPYKLSAPVNAATEISHYYTNPQQCAHYLNEAKYSGNSYLQERRSLNVSFNMSTINSKLSPVFDFDRTNAILSHSLVNNPKQSDSIYGAPSVILTLDGPNGPNDTDNFTLTNGNLISIPDLDKIVLVESWNSTTRKLKVRGSAAILIQPSTELVAVNSGVTMNSHMVSASAEIYPYFVPETQQNGSVFSKWISREFKLESSSDGLEVKVTGIMYENDSIKLYYRTRTEGFDGNLTDVNWIPFNGTGLCNDNDKIRVRSSDIVDPRQLSSNDWTEFTWSAQQIPQFTSFSVKVVLTSTNSAKVPLLDDLRCIVTE